MTLDANICSIFYKGGTITDNAIRCIMQNILNLERLNMSYSPLVTDSGVATLVTAKGDQIRELNLAGCQRITDASLRLLQTARALRSLDLRKCEGISSEACHRFVKSSRPSSSGGGGGAAGGGISASNGNGSATNKSPTKKAKARKESVVSLLELEVWVMLEEKLFEKQKVPQSTLRTEVV